jgi:hypothetical protein
LVSPAIEPSLVVQFPGNRKLPSQSASKQDPEANAQAKGDKHDLFDWLVELFLDGKMALDDWREETTEDFQFAAGHQYSDAAMRKARDAKAPTVVFDRIGRNISAVVGLEINNRARAACYPREPGDVEEAELGSSILEWVDDETDALSEDGEAFRDMLICGVGCTDTSMDYLNYDGGMPATVRQPILTCYWDQHAKRKNLVDRAWDAVAKTMPIEEARRICPGWEDVSLHAGWAGVDDDLVNAGVKVDNHRYETNSPRGAKSQERRRVTLIEIQWREVEHGYLVEDIQTGKKRSLPADVGRKLVEAMPDRYEGTDNPGYVYYRAILGGDVLKKSKLEAQDGFTREFMTGYRDETRGYFYGLVRAMKDPQRTANALYSQSIAMMKSGTKNGWALERGAIDDPRKFERNQAKNGANLYFKDGALSAGKAQPLTPSPVPTHTHELLGLSLDQVQQGTGIPIESVAQATGSGPGQTALLESERRRAGMNLLANFFDAKRTHTKRRAKLVLRYAHEFMRDGRLVRVMDEGQVQYVPMWLEDEDIRQYDIIVDESATSPDARERTWMVIQTLLPFLQEMGTPPEILLELTRYVPNMPATLISKLAEFVEQSKEPTPEQQKEQELQERAKEAEVAKVEGQAYKDQTAGALNVAKVQDMGARLTLDASEAVRETALAKAAPAVQVTEFM